MDWARILAYVTGTVDQELLARNEYLATENRILKAQLTGRLKLSDAERGALGEIGHLFVLIILRHEGRRLIDKPLARSIVVCEWRHEAASSAATEDEDEAADIGKLLKKCERRPNYRVQERRTSRSSNRFIYVLGYYGGLQECCFLAHL
jgi:hypothetical protein